jgi:S1-C subfamily serine protease
VKVVGAVSGEEVATLRAFGVDGGAVHERFVLRQLRLAQGRGYLVTKVMKDTEAKRLGLEPDDIILRINGEPTMRPNTVVSLLGEPATWQDLRVRVLRDGELVDLPGR